MIKGLRYIENFISNELEKELIHSIDNAIWSTELSRRVQHYVSMTIVQDELMKV